jgi:hypothetical protein
MAIGLIGLAVSIPNAGADTILVFGQNGLANDFTATNNGSTGAAGGTTLSAVNISITISGIENDVSLPGSFPLAFLNLSATSDSNATSDGSGNVVQEFNGSFSITSLAGGAGVNYLSGTFSDAVFGTGAALTLTASGPGGVPTLLSDVIGDLSQIRAMSLAFANVTPGVHITGNQTLGGFTSSVSGNFSAAPEPESLMLLTVGVSGLLAFVRWRKRAAKA